MTSFGEGRDPIWEARHRVPEVKRALVACVTRGAIYFRTCCHNQLVQVNCVCALYLCVYAVYQSNASGDTVLIKKKKKKEKKEKCCLLTV